mmetsp:Transcript_37117/g.82577  ORF Transcript_37117/g.82577 Transcript_37117/m.82577 type:complete len:275 (-) Transcript_37117:3012-3836(-)
MSSTHSAAAHETGASVCALSSRKMGALSRKTAMRLPSLRPSSTSWESRCTMVWHSSRTGSRKGSTLFWVAYSSTAATLSATCSCCSVDAGRLPPAMIWRQSRMLCTLLLECSRDRNSKNWVARPMSSTSCTYAMLTSSSPPNSLSANSGIGSSSFSSWGTVGRMKLRSRLSIALVAMPVLASCVLALGVPYSSVSSRYSCVTSETMRRQKQRVSPLSVAVAMTSHRAGSRWSSMTWWFWSTSSVCWQIASSTCISVVLNSSAPGKPAWLAVAVR